MHADISLMPNDDDGLGLERSIRANSALEAAGWVRRHLVDPDRAKETSELYASLGFEVMSCNLTPADFGPNCQECAAAACSAYVLIYTRRKPRATGTDFENNKVNIDDETQDTV